MNNERMIESIRKLCKSNSISPTKLEEELGFSQGLISRWKDKTPSLDKIVDIADYFDISLDELIGRKQIIESNINEEFILTLIKLTKENKIVWKTNKVKLELPKNYTLPPDIMHSIHNFNSYPDNEREVYVFVTEYNGTYITLRYNIIIKCSSIQQKEGSLFIQANNTKSTVYQNCTQNQLFDLFVAIFECLFEELPEHRVNDFKKQFIRDNNEEKTRNIKLHINIENAKY